MGILLLCQNPRTGTRATRDSIYKLPQYSIPATSNLQVANQSYRSASSGGTWDFQIGWFTFSVGEESAVQAELAGKIQRQLLMVRLSMRGWDFVRSSAFRRPGEPPEGGTTNSRAFAA